MIPPIFSSLNEETINHSKRVAQIAELLAKSCNINPELAFLAGLWHDIGKSKMIDIISKTGSLSESEREIINKHPEIGSEIISENYFGPYKTEILEVALTHHKRIDGGGYPIEPKNISPSYLSQLIAISDCFEAITAKRSYKAPVSPNDAKEKILNGCCGTFSKKIINIFLSNYDKIIENMF